MNEEFPDGEEESPPPKAPEPPKPPAGEIVPFIPDEEVDIWALPEDYDPKKDGGHLMIVYELRRMAWEDYDEYLRTHHWQTIRERTFQIHGRRCTLGVQCSGPLDVHHRTYENLGDEKPEDTEVLCRKHHGMKHQTYRDFVRAQGELQFNRDEDE